MREKDGDEIDFEFIDAQSPGHLNYQQKILYQEIREDLIEYLRKEGKKPKKNIGYKESNVRPLARRIHQVYRFAWENDRETLEIDQRLANQFLEALNDDEITKNDGEAYVEGSKRKFVNELEALFRFKETEWEQSIEFGDSSENKGSDPLYTRERRQLLNAALEYKSPPNYSNLSPEERDRWKAQIAQEIGKPKEEVTPSDFSELRRTWKYASLIATTLDAGLRAAMVGRLETKHLDLENNEICIPAEIAVKNDQSWIVTLTDRSTRILEKWLEQRENKIKYDDSDKIWLTRKRNPYSSSTLNSLLNNLLDEAGINPDGRTITWHSIRHSTGMYLYNEYNDLGLVAEVLRHKSLESARKYAHPTPETKQNAIESIQEGGSL